MNQLVAPGFPAASFAACQGLRPADTAAFPGVRLSPNRVRARHIDGRDCPLGQEVYGEEVPGRPFVSYTRGARKGLVVSRIPQGGPVDIVLVEGALAALAAAALDGGDGVRRRVFVGVGGFWNGQVASEVGLSWPGEAAGGVLVAFSDHHAAGARMREAALWNLGALGLSAHPLPCPPGGWRAGLIAARAALVEVPQ